MAQRQRYECDDCGHEVGTVSAPVIYVVVGTHNGEMDKDVRLPPQIWAILKRATPRQDFGPECFAQTFKTKLMTLEEFEAAEERKKKKKAQRRGGESVQEPFVVPEGHTH